MREHDRLIPFAFRPNNSPRLLRLRPPAELAIKLAWPITAHAAVGRSPKARKHIITVFLEKHADPEPGLVRALGACRQGSTRTRKARRSGLRSKTAAPARRGAA